MNTALKKEVNCRKEIQENTLLPILLKAQAESDRNYLSEEAVNEIAERLNLSRSRVYSTASFYSEISFEPRGKHLIRLCCNAPCENAGKRAVESALKNKLKIDIGETTSDGMFTLESVNCLGACYMSPAMKINDQVYGNLTPEQAIEIITGIEKEK